MIHSWWHTSEMRLAAHWHCSLAGSGIQPLARAGCPHSSSTHAPRFPISVTPKADALQSAVTPNAPHLPTSGSPLRSVRSSDVNRFPKFLESKKKSDRFGNRSVSLPIFRHLLVSYSAPLTLPSHKYAVFRAYHLHVCLLSTIKSM